MSPTVLFLAVPVAILAASCFGMSANLQYRASHQVPQRRAADPRMFFDLIQLRIWQVAIGLSILGFGFQVLALRFGPVMIVQPLLVTNLLFYVLITPALAHRRPDGPRIIGALLALVGISAFLLVARPTDQGGRDLQLVEILPLTFGLGIPLVLCLAGSHLAPKPWRPLPLALATGICYGVTAGLVRSLSNRFGDGFPELFYHWQLYAIAILGPLGVLLNQNTFQAGNLGSPALSIIITVDPLVSIGVGLLWLNGEVTGGVAAIVGEILALAVMATGITLLAFRAPHLMSRSTNHDPATATGSGAGGTSPGQQHQRR